MPSDENQHCINTVTTDVNFIITEKTPCVITINEIENKNLICPEEEVNLLYPVQLPT